MILNIFQGNIKKKKDFMSYKGKKKFSEKICIFFNFSEKCETTTFPSTIHSEDGQLEG